VLPLFTVELFSLLGLSFILNRFFGVVLLYIVIGLTVGTVQGKTGVYRFPNATFWMSVADNVRVSR